jgi:YegS/Rv2252/BmrU family lipid kinase
MKYLFILNPISGAKNRVEDIIDYIAAEMAPSGHQYDFACTTHAGEAQALSGNAVQEGYDIIVAAGGDGTINEVASSLVGCQQACLGIIPLGSGNGIARSLGIPLSLKKAVQQLLRPEQALIDIGKVNDRFFVGICGLGFDANIGKKFQDFGIRGPLPYFFIGFKEFLLYRADEFNLYLDDQRLQIRPLLVAIANTPQYGNGAVIAPDANPGDGILDICILPELNLLKAAALTRRLFSGTINNASEYLHFRGKEFTITGCSGQCIIHTDGEPHLMPAELHISILEKALKVCTGRAINPD